LNWVIHENYLIGIIIGIAIAIPSLILLWKGMKDAETETLKPSQETVMFGGIYQHIRHI